MCTASTVDKSELPSPGCRLGSGGLDSGSMAHSANGRNASLSALVSKCLWKAANDWNTEESTGAAFVCRGTTGPVDAEDEEEGVSRRSLRAAAICGLSLLYSADMNLVS